MIGFVLLFTLYVWFMKTFKLYSLPDLNKLFQMKKKNIRRPCEYSVLKVYAYPLFSKSLGFPLVEPSLITVNEDSFEFDEMSSGSSLSKDGNSSVGDKFSLENKNACSPSS